MGRRLKKGGGDGTWTGWFSEKLEGAKSAVGLKPTQSSIDLLPSKSTLVDNVVKEGAQPLMTAGRRLKKHFGVDPTSQKDAEKLLKTAKGDHMLGKRKRRKTRRKY